MLIEFVDTLSFLFRFIALIVEEGFHLFNWFVLIIDYKGTMILFSNFFFNFAESQ
jgi:hypothetical protein